MKINFDIDTYKTRFLGGARSYLFFCIFAFPQELTKDRSQDNLRGQIKALGGRAAEYSSSILGGGPTGAQGEVAASAVYDFSKRAISVFGYGKQDDIITYLVKSTSLPSSTFEEKVIDWQGLPYKLAGDRTYDDWNVTFNVDEEGLILHKFYKWQEKIQDPTDNKRSCSDEYMRDQEVHLIDYSGNSLRRYKLYGAWPKNVNHIALDYSTNEIAQVEVSFSYQYHTILPGSSDAYTADTIKRGVQRAMGVLT